MSLYDADVIICIYKVIAKGCVLMVNKTTTLNLRIEPRLKHAVQEAAILEQRSVANLIEVLIRKHCEEKGISIPLQASLFTEDNHR